MTKIKRLLWGVDKQPDIRDIIALVSTLAFTGFFVEYFLTGKPLEVSYLYASGGLGTGTILSKCVNLKPKK